MSRCSNIPACYLILKQEEKVLLLERKNTGYCDGEYSFIAGHVEEDESFSQAMIREAYEEAGITVTEEDISVCHMMHRNSDDAVRVDVFFTASHWEGEIQNREPDKCAGLKWFALDALPQNIIPYIRETLEHISRGEYYSEKGW